MVEALSRKMLLTLIQTRILPGVENRSAPLCLALPPFTNSGSVRVTPHAAPLLPMHRKTRNVTKVTQWIEHGYNSTRYPTLMWVVEGEADYRIGVTRSMTAQRPELSTKYGYYVASLPAESFFIIPPETPISDGSRPHWERPNISDAYSRLLWFHLMPAGLTFHMCTTQGEHHTSTRSYFLNEPKLMSIADDLLEELRATSPVSDELARQYLIVLLLHCQRRLMEARNALEEESNLTTTQHAIGHSNTPLQRAYSFIEAHLSQKITVDHIAAHAFVSRSQLNRLFYQDQKMSPVRYLTQRRLERACSLLKTTDLPVKRIGVLCGYPQAEHFSRIFLRYYEVTPGEFRLRD
jgi:AraC-like DNA-binding protein